MHKIGIISDTHNLLRQEVLEYLAGCEQILHAGDISSSKILEQLEAIAPVTVVRGNNDKEWASQIPETCTLDLYGLRIFMVHKKMDIPKVVENSECTNLVIYGHSHKYEDKEGKRIHYLNPGSCGPRRFGHPITMAILEVEEDGNYWIRKIEIPHAESSDTASDPEEEKIPDGIRLMIPDIMKEIDAGKTVKQIARKHNLSEKLAEQIMRMYLTHPGVDVDGILRRIGV